MKLSYRQSPDSHAAKRSNPGSVRRHFMKSTWTPHVCGHITDVLRPAAWQFTGIHIGIPRNLPDLCKLLVMCTMCVHQPTHLFTVDGATYSTVVENPTSTSDTGRSHPPLLQLCCLLTHLVLELTVDCLIHMLAGGTSIHAQSHIKYTRTCA